MADVSIIIVNWNTKQLLLDCIDSLLRETKRYDLEIIVVDNASQDGSAEAVEARFPAVRVIRNPENLGFAKANNIGIRASSAPYYCLVNSDIEVMPECVDRLLEYIRPHTDIAILGPKTLNGDRSLRVNCRTFPSIWSSFCLAVGLSKIFPRYKFFSDSLMTYFPHDVIRPVDVLPGCFLMVRRQASDAIGLLDENFFFYAEDKDWCRRFHDQNWNVVFYPYAEAIHYAGQSASRAPARFMVEKMKANFYYWKKHDGETTLKLFKAVMIIHHGTRVLGFLAASFLRPLRREEYVHKMQSSSACLRYLFSRTPKSKPIQEKT